MEAGVGLECKAVRRTAGTLNHSFEVIEESVREKAHHFVGPAAVFLLPFVAVFLNLRMGEKILQTVNFRLIGIPVERMSLGIEKAGDISVFGFDNLFGRAPVV